MINKFAKRTCQASIKRSYEQLNFDCHSLLTSELISQELIAQRFEFSHCLALIYQQALYYMLLIVSFLFWGYSSSVTVALMVFLLGSGLIWLTLVKVEAGERKLVPHHIDN